ncbi:MAG: arylamine N-acetyltransferase [Chloroflexota bacterium]
MNIDAYLKRINYNGQRTPTIQTLHALHQSHLLAVPFENLSIHIKEPIILNDEALFDKVVQRRRGGFCYELNGLFAALLRQLGFQVTMIAANVVDRQGNVGPDFDHMALRVSLDEDWLVDVGFGDSFREPLLLSQRDIQYQPSGHYRIDDHEDHLLLMAYTDDAEWQTQYHFRLQSYQYADYIAMCHYHQTSSESPFTQGRICTVATPHGRKTISKMRFITTTLDGTREEREITDESAFLSLLQKHFGIRLPS